MSTTTARAKAKTKTKKAAASKSPKMKADSKKSTSSKKRISAKPKIKTKPKVTAESLDTMTPMEHGLTAQPKMRIARKKPASFQREQSRMAQSQNSVNPASRR